MKKIFITGANGFVGRNLINLIQKEGIDFVEGTRQLYGDITTQNNWPPLLNDCDVVVHLAARVHVMEETDVDPIKSFRKMNVETTVNLARASKASGIKRFIYISSIKVNGEATENEAFKASDKPAPQDAYGISKAEAEIELMKLHEPKVFEIVIIRPPLVYGPEVKANFEKLYGLIKKSLPLPFGGVDNKRSLVSVKNLSDLILRCCVHPNAAGEIFLVSDGIDYSLKELLIQMGNTLNVKPVLINVPVSIMKFGLKIIGKTSYADRLFGNLHVDISKTKKLLNWTPPYSFEDTYKNI